ncbi:MAG: hypothetical protein PHW60_13165 [Kiritimatiellae bacterium]|nr:hypothetical protein [Kiritimatiellia bacterium]
MKEARITSIGCCTIVGEIFGDRICVKTHTGNVHWVKKDAPVYQRGSFFDALFNDTAFAGSNATCQNIRYDLLSCR